MQPTLTLACLLLCTTTLLADYKARGRSAWAWAVSSNSSESPNSSTKVELKSSKDFNRGSDDALDEVNAERAKRGLPPFQHDPLLTQAALTAAKTRASHLWAGHLQSDFACLPPGASADAAGCAAWPNGEGWGSCCTYDNYSHAGAAWAIGADGRRYMHLFVRGTSSKFSPDSSEAPLSQSCANGECVPTKRVRRR